MNTFGWTNLIVIILAAAIAIFVQYWVIRLAVSHALRDHATRQQRTGDQTQP